MKFLFSLLLVLVFYQGFGQQRLPYREEFTHPEILAAYLTRDLKTEKQKARAIYLWIAGNIRYNTAIFNPRSFIISLADPADTMSIWRDADEMTALRVLHRGYAVCDGYARLFKTLCSYAGLQSVVITGYGRCFGERTNRFRTNHAWNAVRIDSLWELVDVTWGSGYIDYAGDFVQRTDETYFMTPPSRFIYDHMPEDVSWTLLKEPPLLKEFEREPFRFRSFVKYGIAQFLPEHGTIEAYLGDTVRIEVLVRDPEKNKMIAPASFDSLLANALPRTAWLKSEAGSKRMIYLYVVGEQPASWINIMYNNDPVLRYNLRIKKGKKDNR